MEQSIFKISPKDDSTIADWLVSNKDLEATTEWYAKFTGTNFSDHKSVELSKDEIKGFYVTDPNEYFPHEEFEEMHENEEVDASGYKIIARGKEVFDISDAPIFICATTEY